MLVIYPHFALYMLDGEASLDYRCARMAKGSALLPALVALVTMAVWSRLPVAGSGVGLVRWALLSVPHQGNASNRLPNPISGPQSGEI